MPSDRALEPWRSFLAEVDVATPRPLELHCIGGFAVTMFYELVRGTGDLDVFDVIPNDAAQWLASLAGEGSALHKKHKLYIQIASVATLPYEYAGRLIEVFAGEFEHLRLLVADRYDLALSKLPRNLDVDFEDVKHLARSPDFDLGTLERRYYAELRPYVSGPPERHDLTLKLWVEAITEERASRHS
jgi:hypothetical protein